MANKNSQLPVSFLLFGLIGLTIIGMFLHASGKLSPDGWGWVLWAFVIYVGPYGAGAVIAANMALFHPRAGTSWRIMAGAWTLIFVWLWYLLVFSLSPENMTGVTSDPTWTFDVSWVWPAMLPALLAAVVTIIVIQPLTHWFARTSAHHSNP